MSLGSRTLSQAQLDALENIIDHSSLEAVVDGLATIALQKAAHIEEAWQDRGLAREWRSASNYLEKVSHAVAIRRVP
jgi:hypothetical protein